MSTQSIRSNPFNAANDRTIAHCSWSELNEERRKKGEIVANCGQHIVKWMRADNNMTDRIWCLTSVRAFHQPTNRSIFFSLLIASALNWKRIFFSSAIHYWTIIASAMEMISAFFKWLVSGRTLVRHKYRRPPASDRWTFTHLRCKLNWL